MSEVVITGMGVCCTLGNSVSTASNYLRKGESKPFTPWQPAVDNTGRCQLIGLCDTDLSDEALGLKRGQTRFMGRTSRLAFKAAQEATAQAKCPTNEVAIIVGSGTGDVGTHIAIQDALARTRDMKRIPPTVIPKIMGSSVSANLAALFEATGPSCSVTAACAGGAWNIVLAAMLIQSGAAKYAIAGGVEIPDPHFYSGFDSMRAFNSQDNDRPETASRPYDANRGGFIFGEGSGILVLETRANAEARGAEILGVLAGFGMSSDGTGNMVQPSRNGGLRSMRAALKNAGVEPSQVEYINTHGTSTPLGDVEEVRGIRELLSDRHIPYSSTKGYTGHTISGCGAIEAIFCLDMMNNRYIAPCVNISRLDPELEDYPPIMVPTEQALGLCMSNSYGFGGTNVSLVLTTP